MIFPHGETVTIVSTTTTTTPLGDTTTTTTEVEWGPCAVAPRYATENTDPSRPATIVGLTVYGPVVDLDADDQLRIRGEVYDVDGGPGEWRSPFTGWEAGMEVPVKRAGS